jgi:putative PIN family toxin of toxin-antitoxin system
MKYRRPIVIDTNSLLQIIPKRSPYRPIWDAFLEHRFTLCLTNEILEEYEEILCQHINEVVAEGVVSFLLNSSAIRFVYPTFHFHLIENDPDDNKFVDCAIAGGADYLVTEDSHFYVLKSIPFPVVSVIDMDEFMEILKR